MPDLQAHSPAMGQKDGAEWTAAVGSQPMLPKSDRLLALEDRPEPLPAEAVSTTPGSAWDVEPVAPETTAPSSARPMAGWNPFDLTLVVCVLAAMGLGAACLQGQQSAGNLPPPHLPELPPAPRLPWPVPVPLAIPAAEPLVPPGPGAAVQAPDTLAVKAALRPADAAPAAPGEFHLVVGFQGAGHPLLAANEAYARGNLQEAGRRYTALRAAHPRDPAPLLGLAAVARRQGDVSAATAYYRQVLARSPGNPDALLGLALATNGVPSAGEVPVSAGVGESATRHHARGTFLAQAGQWAQARSQFAAAAALAPQLADHALALAVAFDRLGLRDSAKLAYVRALKLGSSDTTFPAGSVARRLASLSGGE